MYKNKEGYHDPTAGMACGKLMSDYKKEQRERWKRRHEMKNRRKIYIVSEYSPCDMEKNMIRSMGHCAYVIENGGIPVARHLFYPTMLEDELGLMFGLALMPVCDEVWVFAKKEAKDVSKEVSRQVSKAMEEELREAKRLNKPIHYVEVV